MTFLEKLEFLMKARGLNTVADFANASGIPYTTIDGFYKKGYQNTKISTLKKIASFFNVTIDFLVDEDEPITQTNIFTEEEIKLVNAYRSADEEHRRIVNFTLAI